MCLIIGRESWTGVGCEWWSEVRSSLLCGQCFRALARIALHFMSESKKITKENQKSKVIWDGVVITLRLSSLAAREIPQMARDEPP